MERSAPNIPPGPEPPALTDEDRAQRLEFLAERLCSAGGLDRDTLSQIEQLGDSDQHGLR